MNVLVWVLFGAINGLLLYTLEDKKHKTRIHPLTATTLGIFGALSGGTMAYLLFGGAEKILNVTLLLAVAFEAILFYLLINNKSLKRI